MARLIIEAEFNVSALDWQGEQPVDLIKAYNDYYKQFPYEAFEIALKDDKFFVTKATIVE